MTVAKAVFSLTGTNHVAAYAASDPIGVGRALRLRFFTRATRASGSAATTTTVKLCARYDDGTVQLSYFDLPSSLDDVQGSAQPKGQTRETEHAFTTATGATGVAGMTGVTDCTPFYLDDARGIPAITVNVKTNATGTTGDITTVYMSAG